MSISMDDTANIKSLPSRTNGSISDDDDGSSSSRNSNDDDKKWKVHDTPQDSGLIPTIAVTLWLGWNGFVLWIMLYGIIFADNVARAVIIGSISASLALPANFPGQLGYRMGDWMMVRAEKYFGLKTVIEDEDDLIHHSEQNKALIFAFSPHDMLPYAVFAFNPILRRLPGKIGREVSCLMTSAVFNVPFLKHVYSWVRGLPVDKRTFLRRLHSGESFTFNPGGVQEVLMTNPQNPNDVILYLKKRKGFVKLALSTGSPIVTTFGFNLDGSYGHWFPRNALVERISRRMGVVPLVFWGRWCIPFGIPNPQKIHIVIGRGKYKNYCSQYAIFWSVALNPVIWSYPTPHLSLLRPDCSHRCSQARRECHTGKH
mmetsp:Transcript_21293/g.51448  ORF Transcript_21293/g.51448 Transcript_21293/m.51448 type:complete len:371 (-) Transcript_21293:203-1315(-)